ncbi:DUF3027 domain-containing protein [Agromyces arachidis]|uniref:DUF3027 domain-containing protein n=1 Tax=Agromyces arachidis TaxID=766966 RepID=UPI0040567F2E
MSDAPEAVPATAADPDAPAEESRPEPDADEVLLASAALAQRALLETTPPETVGSLIGHVVEDEHVLSLHFAADLSGYPGWHWSVTLARVEDGEPTVLETELMPGERALLAPEWVPWSERLAEYRAAQAAAAASGEDAEDDEAEEPDLAEERDADDGFGDDEDDADESDDADDDDVFDGIDIDALADDDDA